MKLSHLYNSNYMQYISVYALIDFVSLLLKCAPDIFRTYI